MTDPPIVGDLGVAVSRRFGAPLLVISEDVFPEIATELGRLTNPLVVQVLRRLVAFYLKRADHIVAIGDRMRERLIAKGASPERISVIPNWVDAAAIVPGPRENDWARAQTLTDRFVVMHSGNVGHAQDLDNLVRATTFLRDLDDLAVPDRRFRRPSRRGRRALRIGSKPTRCVCFPTSRARCCRSRSAAPTSTTSVSPRGSPASSSRAGCTASSRPDGR